MGVRIKFDSIDKIQEPTLVLATKSGRTLGRIPATNIVFKECLNSYSDLSFQVYKYDNNIECRLWKDIKDFKLIYCKEWDLWFEISVEIEDGDNVVKNVTGKTLCEAELSQIKLYNIEINTESDISRDDYKEPTVLFDEENPSTSLLNRIMEKLPHYSIKHVDATIAKIQKTFSFNDVSFYDACQQISEEIGCLFVFNSGKGENSKIARTIDVYDLQTICNDCGYRGDYTTMCPKCGSTDIVYGFGKDTGIYVSVDNLAEGVTYSADTDVVKNCFKIEGGDDLMNATVRNCNPNGSDYIWYISNEAKEDMSSELVSKIEEYDVKYQDWQKNNAIEVDASAITTYNSLVDKYVGYKENLTKIISPIVGYSSLMEAFYNTIDLSVFLQSGLMPNLETSDTSAEAQASLLTMSALSPTSVSNLSSLSKAVAENAILGLAKILVQSDYQVRINDSSLSGYVWTGNFKITNFSNEEDTAISNTISVTINNNIETYVKQKIQKAINDVEDKSSNIIELFDLSLSEFKTELKDYCLDSLLIFNNACQTALNILIEQGWATGDSDLNANYSDTYKAYYQKSKAIQSEIKVREDEISSIIGVYDNDNLLVEYGIQNYIEDARSAIQKDLNFESSLGEDLWAELCAYRREDKYSNQNYISDGLNNAELFDRARELFQTASNEIFKSATLQHSISSTLRNLLAMEAFKSITKNFEVGNWIRIKVDDSVYKLRLIQYEIDFENLEDIHVEFSDVINISNGVSDVQSVLNQASSMASSYNYVAHQASQGSNSNDKLNTWADKGLSLTNMKIVSGADNQEISWDNHGFSMKEYLPITDTYSDNQLKIINKGLYITDNNWETSRAAIGSIIYTDPETNEQVESYGVIADTLIGKMMITDKLGIYTENNNISLDKNGLMITDNSTTVTINPDNSNGIFVIANSSKGELLYADKDGDLYVKGIIQAEDFINKNGESMLTENDLISAEYLSLYGLKIQSAEDETVTTLSIDNDGTITIGNGNFVVNPDGTAEINNIIMSGSITWNTSNNPVQVRYATSPLSTSTPLDSGWHETYDEANDYYAIYSYDGGKTWSSSAIKIRGVDGEPGQDGANGSDANIPTYIKDTYIDETEIRSPKILSSDFSIYPLESDDDYVGGFNLFANLSNNQFHFLRIGYEESAGVPYINFYSPGGAYANWSFPYTSFSKNVNFSGDVSFSGASVNFNNADVTGIVATFG